MFEIGTPACLPLGIVKFEEGEHSRLCTLGMALQHPPVHLEVKKSQRLLITGPRADVGREYALRYLRALGLPSQGEIEVELAIPAYMGLESETLMGLSVAAGIAEVHGNDPNDTLFIGQNLALEPSQSLALWAATRGGLLLVDSEPDGSGIPPLIHRAEPDQSEQNAWALVLVLPRVSSDEHAITLEADRMNALLQAGSALDPASGRLFNDVLWPAVENDDLPAFGDGLAVPQLNAKDEEILAVMAQNGAIAWGQSPTGLGLYALARGARATIDMRAALRPVMDYTTGHMVATIAHADGMRAVERQLGF